MSSSNNLTSLLTLRHRKAYKSLSQMFFNHFLISDLQVIYIIRQCLKVRSTNLWLMRGSEVNRIPRIWPGAQNIFHVELKLLTMKVKPGHSYSLISAFSPSEFFSMLLFFWKIVCFEQNFVLFWSILFWENTVSIE